MSHLNPTIRLLFREHRRLANKLTKDEMKALRSYLNKCLIQEHGEMVFELDNLKTAYSSKVFELEDKLSEIQKELKFKTELLEQYKSSDNSLAMVHKQREKRLEHKQSFLLLDLEKGQDALKDLQTQKQLLENELQQKENTIGEQISKIEDLKLALAEQNNQKNRTVEDRAQRLNQDILKLKLDMDQRNKECQKLQMEKLHLSNEKNKLEANLEEQVRHVNEMKETLQSNSKQLATKCEQLSMLQYQLELEKKKMTDFQKDLQMKENFGQMTRRGSSDQDVGDVVRIKADNYRSQVQYFECRIKLLEEKIAMYRNQVRDMSREITDIAEDVNKSSHLKDRIFVHGTTIVEKIQRELHEHIVSRRTKLEASLDEILRSAPIAISKEACEIRADALTLKKQAEVHRINDVLVRTSRLLTRVDACEKTKFSGKFLTGNGHVMQNGTTNNNARPKSEIRPKKDDSQERCFTIVTKKQANGHLLSRPRQMNGSALPLWKRKHSLSMDMANCISPALIDLNLTPGNSPSPKDKKTFFPSSQSTPSIEGKRSLSDSSY
ncbi:uncharacterized protein MG328-like [Ylistrum balloti]|uniref:uncharacterized protein MG328-like n=1 Tax=Ylistrum balloti TaxID=509963 RepID=UPI002905B0C9|nr:uncharacterized protein MG328-like [Ylistrum balloti]